MISGKLHKLLLPKRRDFISFKYCIYISSNLGGILKPIVWELCSRIFSSVFSFCKISFTDNGSRIWLPDCSKFTVNWKHGHDITILRYDVIVIFFWRCSVFLVKFSYWSKFHVNIITGSGVMAIFFYQGLTRNLEMGNTIVWLLANIWRLEWEGNNIFGTKVSNKMLLNAAKCQGYNFYRFRVIKRKPKSG